MTAFIIFNKKIKTQKLERFNFNCKGKSSKPEISCFKKKNLLELDFKYFWNVKEYQPKNNPIIKNLIC